jgi:hypothetical protein
LAQTHLAQETLLQIASLENISLSKQIQLDELMAQRDIESVGADRQRYAGQRVVRAVDVEGDGQNQPQEQQTDTGNANNWFKLTLQDTRGQLCYAVECEKLPFLTAKNLKSGFPIQLGSKVLVKEGCPVEEGVLLLNKDCVEFLGGIVPEWNIALAERHVEFLKDQIRQL